MKLTLKVLQSAKPGSYFPDPAVPGLRYRVTTAGIVGQLRVKVASGGWKSVGLGKLPSPGTAIGKVNEHARAMHKRVMAETGDRYEAVFEAANAIQRADLLHVWLAPMRRLAEETLERVKLDGGIRKTETTLRDLIDRYLEHHVADLRPNSQREARRYLLTTWAPLHNRPAAALTRREVAEHLLTLKAKGPVAANRARATLHACFSWALSHDLVPLNPVTGTRQAAEPVRQRKLRMEELRAIWAATESPSKYNTILRLLMLTGQRRDEVGGMRWSELDLDAALWRLPASRTKNKREHEVPLSEPAVALLRAQERRPGRDMVFGLGEGSFGAWAVNKAALDERLSLPPWRLHDLRHAFSTHLHELGVAPHVVEACINHVSGYKAGVAGRYNAAQYIPERVRAMALWADHLLEAAPAKVIPLARPRPLPV
jgi:integrase